MTPETEAFMWAFRVVSDEPVSEMSKEQLAHNTELAQWLAKQAVYNPLGSDE